mgnify:CR=1 FL=1
MAESKTKKKEEAREVKEIGVTFVQGDFISYENKRKETEYNVSYCLDGEDIFFPAGKTSYEASVTGGKLIPLSTHPELVEMIMRGSYEHTFSVDGEDVTDEEAVRIAHANIGEVQVG